MSETSGGGEDYRKVMLAVRDFIFEKHKFPQVNDIIDATRIQKLRCNEMVDQLIGQKQLYVAFDGAGLPKVILPYDMMQSVIMTQKRPSWIENYSFQERKRIDSEMQSLREQYAKYDMFERILYLTDIPLEAAVAFTLEWLDFKEVKHHVDNKDFADITFQNEKIKALVEVEGPTKQGDKQKILQLDGWVKVEIEKDGTDPTDIQGVFIVNHFRETDPELRSDPLTDQAKKFLRRYQFRFLTTYALFKITKEVLGGTLTKEKARMQVWAGQEIK